MKKSLVSAVMKNLAAQSVKSRHKGKTKAEISQYYRDLRAKRKKLSTVATRS